MKSLVKFIYVTTDAGNLEGKLKITLEIEHICGFSLETNILVYDKAYLFLYQHWTKWTPHKLISEIRLK